MSEIAVLPITPDLSTKTLRQAWRDRSGFVWLAPGEMIRPASPMLEGAPPSPSDGWFNHLHNLVGHAPDLGVQFFTGGRIAGPGYAFVDDQLVLQDSYLPKLSIELLPQQPEFQAANHDRLEAINVFKPVIEIIGPGSHVYGHWLIDFLPRAIIAREVLGQAFDSCSFALPDHVPGWALTMLTRLTGFRTEQAIRYDPSRQYIEARDGLLSPTYARVSDGYIHSFVRDVYGALCPKAPRNERRLLCLSRTRLGGATTYERHFAQADFFDAAAAARGFEVVHPEMLSFDEQLTLYASAAALVGEHGSALYNAMFAPAGCILGCVAFSTPDMSRIAALYAQRNIYLIPAEECVQNNIGFSSVAEADIEIFLDAIVRHQRETLID